MFWFRGVYFFVLWIVDLSNMFFGKRWFIRRSVIVVGLWVVFVKVKSVLDSRILFMFSIAIVLFFKKVGEEIG